MTVESDGKQQPVLAWSVEHELPSELIEAIDRRHVGPPLQPTGAIIDQRLDECRSCQRFNGRICRLAAGCGAVTGWALRILDGCRYYHRRT